MKKLIFSVCIFLISFSITATPVKVENEGSFKFLELYGYFAFNFNFIHNLKLDGNNPHLKIDPSDSDHDIDKIHTWAKTKLHLEPVLNIAEVMEVHGKIDAEGK